MDRILWQMLAMNQEYVSCPVHLQNRKTLFYLRQEGRVINAKIGELLGVGFLSGHAITSAIMSAVVSAACPRLRGSTYRARGAPFFFVS